MSVLDLEEVLDYELELLNTPGEALSDFYSSEAEAKIFLPSEPKTNSKINLVKRLINPKTSLNSSNGVFHIIAHSLMKVIFTKHHNYQMLQHLKCALYSPKICITQALSDATRKKILAQFFHVLQYNTADPEQIFMKYPIVMEVFTFFFRTILNILGVSGALNYHKKIPSAAAIAKIFDYFDMNYHCRKGMFIIDEEHIALYIDSKTDQIYFGQMKMMDESRSDHSFNFSQESGNQDPSQIEKREQSMSTPTPQFGEFAEEQINFKRDSHRRKNSSSENNKGFDFKFGDEAIEEMDEEQDDIRKSKKSNRGHRRMSENNIPMMFDANRIAQLIGNKEKIDEQSLNSPQSPMPEVLNSFGSYLERRASNEANPEKSERNSPFSHTGTNNKSFEEQGKTKSDTFWKQKVPKEKIKSLKQENYSNFSCSCLDTRAKRNKLKSGVVEVSISPYNNYSKQNSNFSQSTSNLLLQEEFLKQSSYNNSAHIHSFLKKGKTNHHGTNLNPKMDRPIASLRNREKLVPKAKVNFTYGNPNSCSYRSTRVISDYKKGSQHFNVPMPTPISYRPFNSISPRQDQTQVKQQIHHLCPKRRSIFYKPQNIYF